jgi:pimeloyl-ACP methyl ester carboxylesterase
MSFVTVQGHRIEYELLHGHAPVIVFLHEGLGSLSAWRNFPARVARETGCAALVYSRYGYGKSDPLDAPRSVDFMHQEALLSLPELLDKLGIERPVLFGHSDGGSIALIYAGGAQRPVRGVIAMAPHVMVEDISISSIEAAKAAFETTDLREKLSPHHSHPDSAFWGWNDIWLLPEFRTWNIEEYLPRIACPVLAIQGEEDEYGTMHQIERVQEVAPDVRLLKLKNCRHSPHRDQPEAVIQAATEFIGGLDL